MDNNTDNNFENDFYGYEPQKPLTEKNYSMDRSMFDALRDGIVWNGRMRFSRRRTGC